MDTTIINELLLEISNNDLVKTCFMDNVSWFNKGREGDKTTSVRISVSNLETATDVYELIVHKLGKPNDVTELFVSNNAGYCRYIYYTDLTIYLDGYIVDNCKIVKETVIEKKLVYKCVPVLEFE